MIETVGFTKITVRSSIFICSMNIIVCSAEMYFLPYPPPIQNRKITKKCPVITNASYLISMRDNILCTLRNDLVLLLCQIQTTKSTGQQRAFSCLWLACCVGLTLKPILFANNLKLLSFTGCLLFLRVKTVNPTFEVEMSCVSRAKYAIILYDRLNNLKHVPDMLSSNIILCKMPAKLLLYDSLGFIYELLQSCVDGIEAKRPDTDSIQLLFLLGYITLLLVKDNLCEQACLLKNTTSYIIFFESHIKNKINKTNK